MGVGVNSGLRQSPDWTPHRVQVAAADASTPFAGLLKTHGMAAAPFEDILADIKIAGGGGSESIDVELLIWSELSAAFVPFSTPVKVTALTASKMIKFNVGGNRFFLHVSGTFDDAKVDISCAGMNPVQVQSA